MLSWFIRKLLYHPEKKFIGTPTNLGLRYTDVIFETKNKRRLNGWWIPHSHSQKTFLYFHGNAGNISSRLPKIKILNELDVNVFIFDYAGFGKSPGKPNEEILYEDAQAAYDYVVHHLNIKTEDLILQGESLGCAVAIHTALENKIGGLILSAPFLSLKNIANYHYPFISFLAGNRFDNFSKIENIHKPKLFIHSKKDEIIPIEHAFKLHDKAKHPKKYLWLDSGFHNDSYVVNKDEFKKSIRDFLNENFFTSPGPS